MEIGVLSAFWLAVSAILVVAYYIDQHPSAPNVWRSLFRWGKMRVGFVVGSNHFYEVPKRWFQHFYIISFLANLSAMFFVCRKVFLDIEWPVFFSSFIELLQYPSGSTGLTNAMPALLVLVLAVVQSTRRSYETFFVNVFSSAATMTLLHYLLGFIFYLSVSLCALAGTDFWHIHMPDAVSTVDGITYAVAVLIFISASQVQHHSFKILAALRSGDKDRGSRTRPTYRLPKGGLFEVVSCPHFLAEVLIYFSYCVVFRFQNAALLSLFVFVLVNQVLAALLNHQWYCLNFPAISKHRHAIFPYVL